MNTLFKQGHPILNLQKQGINWFVKMESHLRKIIESKTLYKILTIQSQQLLKCNSLKSLYILVTNLK